jgi:hypothetical protein
VGLGVVLEGYYVGGCVILNVISGDANCHVFSISSFIESLGKSEHFHFQKNSTHILLAFYTCFIHTRLL